jgi:hypothetical protein
MPANVIPFARRAEPEETEVDRIATGEAFCLSCGHDWVGTAPVGTVNLECPGCGRHVGRFRFGFCPPEGSLVRECNCGNQLFYLTPEGHLCASCGTYQTYD